MSGRRRRRAPPPEPAYRPGQLLDWSDRSHWAWEQLPCRYCAKPTNLRDSKGKAAHKTCAEDALKQQTEERADEYVRNRRV